MMNSIPNSRLLLLVLFLVIAPSTAYSSSTSNYPSISAPAPGSRPGGVDEIVVQTCIKVMSIDPEADYNFCVSTLGSVPESRGASLTDLGVISMKVIMMMESVTEDVLPRVEHLLRVAVDEGEQSVLRTCLSIYSDSMYEMRNAVEDYLMNKMFDVKMKLSTGLVAGNTCEDEFKDVQVDSPLTTLNNHVVELSAIALDIVTLTPPT